MIITKGKKIGALYLCSDNIESSISLVSTGMNTSLWHYKLGHMSEKGM
jgi:hypothetical protein